MTRRELAATKILDAGTDFALIAANNGGEKFINDGRMFVAVQNTDTGGGGTDHTVTIQTQEDVDGLDVDDRIVTVPHGKTTLIGPLPPDVYNVAAGPDTGKVLLDYADYAHTNVVVLRL
jgi:hypothetical protein